MNFSEKCELFEKPLNVLHAESPFSADCNADIESSNLNLYTISECNCKQPERAFYSR